MSSAMTNTVAPAVLAMMLAGSAPASAVTGAPPPPEVRTEDGIRYVSGGVGEHGRAQIERVAGRYPLKLVFSADDGAYLADVDVRIEDSAGREVLAVVSEGPWFYADLAPGSYRVSVAHDGRRFERTVRVDADPTVLRFADWRREDRFASRNSSTS